MVRDGLSHVRSAASVYHPVLERTREEHSTAQQTDGPTDRATDGQTGQDEPPQLLGRTWVLLHAEWLLHPEDGSHGVKTSHTEYEQETSDYSFSVRSSIMAFGRRVNVLG